MARRASLAVALTALHAAAAAAAPVLLDIPPRFMWGWGPGVSGFCGSMSIQTAALHYGNYLTQNAVRGSTGATDGTHELMLENATDSTCCASVVAAAKFHLAVEQWEYWRHPQPQAGAFTEWLAEGVDRGVPVVFGIYMTVEASPQYDHIVPLVGYERGGPPAGGPVTALYFNDLYFNKTLRTPPLWAERARGAGGVGDAVFVKPRAACRGVGEHVGAASYCLPAAVNYGYRVLGNHDPHGELRRVRLLLDANSEPDYSTEDARGMRPVRITGTLRAAELAPSRRHALLEYTAAADVPRGGGFLAAYVARGRTPHYFTAPASGVWQAPVALMSNTTVFYRVVEAVAE